MLRSFVLYGPSLASVWVEILKIMFVVVQNKLWFVCINVCVFQFRVSIICCASEASRMK